MQARALDIVLSCSALVVLLSGCGSTDDEATTRLGRTDSATIIGGTAVGPETLPGVVYLQSGSRYCTGTFVTATHVLTAAHCVGGYSVNGFVGLSNDVRPLTLYWARVRSLAVHPAWTGDISSPADLAIVEVDGTGPLTILPIPIGPLPATLVGTKVTGLGYGCATYRGSPDGQVRRTAIGAISHLSESFHIRPDVGSLFGSPEYAGVGFAACPGDSGGPLLQDGTIVGVASKSWATSSGHVVESAYARIDTHYDWFVALGLAPPWAPPPVYTDHGNNTF